MWLTLHNKDLTRYVLHKRNFIGLRWCYQCHQAKESIVHLMFGMFMLQGGMEICGKINWDSKYLGKGKS